MSRPKEKPASQRRRLVTLLVALALLVVALAVRARALGSFSWPDELTWLERSAAFVTALERGDLAGTYLSDHPGVVPMWGYGGALYARAVLTGDRAPLDGLAAEDYFADVPTQLATAAWFAVIVTSLTVVAAYWLLIPLLGRAGAALAGLLLALDPFYLSHSRIVHVDGLVASFMLLATLSLLFYLKRPQWRGYLFLSGFLAGLALLTKTPALFLIPLAALALGVQWLLRRLGREDWGSLGQAAGAFGLWMLAAWATFMLLWPATWRDPLFFLWRIYKASRWGVVVSHGSNFFLGQVVEDPGSLFYAVVFPFRLSPLVLLLLPVAIVLLVVAWRRKEDVRLPLIGLASIFFFGVMMTLAAKKGDRYLLPAFLMADVVAAWAVVSLIDKLAAFSKDSAHWRRIGYGLVVGLVLLTSLLWLRLAPYYGAYFNPLLGGGKTAAGAFAFGQGEGLDLAAQYLNGVENSQELLAVSFYPPQFRYYFEGDATSLRRGDWDKTWTFADYVVFYVSQVQRRLPSAELVEFFATQEPEYVARLGGVDFALVYRPPLLLSGQPPGVEESLDDRHLAGELALVGYALNAGRVHPGESLFATLYWQALTQIGVDYALQVQLVSEDGAVVWEQAGPSFEEYFPTWWWPPGRTMYDRYQIPLPAALESGQYWLVVSAQAPDGSRVLEPHGPTLEAWPGSLVVGSVEVQSAP